MKKFFIAFILILTGIFQLFSQDTEYRLDSVVISAHRLYPLTYDIIPVSVFPVQEVWETDYSVSGEMETLSGLEVRRRGAGDVQSDLYIRGGNFEQAGIMIDGVPLNDIQTGHHNMDLPLPKSAISRIQLIKGSAARLFGMNAMTGMLLLKSPAIERNFLSIQAGGGSFQGIEAGITGSKKFDKYGIFIASDYCQSEGYRENTDYTVSSNYLKFQSGHWEISGGYAVRNFGANGFYASPEYHDQYEETRTAFGSISHNIRRQNGVLKNIVYWRYNKDRYLFLRQNPDFFQARHFTHRIGYKSNYTFRFLSGTSGLGIHLNTGIIRSDNLGNHRQWGGEIFAEQLWKYHKFSIQPGITLTGYKSFGWVFLPGINLGYRLSKGEHIFLNAGKTSRMPTYTERYYSSPTSQGNPYLKPETAFSTDAGYKKQSDKLSYHAGLFYRTTRNIIDWVRNDENEPWESLNILQTVAKGVEAGISVHFSTGKLRHSLSSEYTYLDETSGNTGYTYSRYLLNAYRHQSISSWRLSVNEKWNVSVQYRFLQRPSGENIHLFDASAYYKTGKWALSFHGNNLLDVNYTSNQVPMPGIRWRTAIKFTL